MFNIYKKNFLSLAVNCIWLSAVNALSLMDTFHANMSAWPLLETVENFGATHYLATTNEKLHSTQFNICIYNVMQRCTERRQTARVTYHNFVLEPLDQLFELLSTLTFHYSIIVMHISSRTLLPRVFRLHLLTVHIKPHTNKRLCVLGLLALRPGDYSNDLRTLVFSQDNLDKPLSVICNDQRQRIPRYRIA